MNEEKIVLSTDYAKIIQDDELLCIAEIDLLHTGKSRNNTYLSKDSVMASIDTIYNKPIICILNSEVRSIAKDFKSHAKSDYEETQRICVGVIPLPEISNPRWYVDDIGIERLRMNVFLWKYYAEDVVRILASKNGESKVSIEIIPLEESLGGDSILNIEKFNFMSVALLGDNIMEGMAGSKLKVIKYSLDETLEKSFEYIERQKSNIDIFEKIKDKKGEQLKMVMGHKELENHLWALLSGQMYTRNKETYHKYYIAEIYSSHLVAWDNETNEEIKFKYNIDDEGIVHIDFTSRKVVDRDKAVRTYATEENGVESKEELKIDKSKISEDAWGGVDKGELRKKVVEAKNFKTIAKDVFLDLREGWENGEVSKMKYPVMQLDEDTLIYNRYALASAKAYAEKNNETEVLEKLKAIYKKFKLDFEIADDSYIYECGKMDYEEDTETDKQAEEEKPKVEMSADANVDASAQAELLNIEAEKNKELADEQNPKVEELKKDDNNIVIAEMEEMKGKIAEYEKEIANLRKFKEDTEARHKLFKMEEVLNECRDDLSFEKIKEFKEIACNYSLDTIDLWINKVKAEAFNSTKGKKANTFQRMDLWEQHTEKTQSNSLWSCANK